jgi:hypothetical protein
VTHSATQEQLEVIDSLQSMFHEQVLPLLTPVEQMWQPSDFLPDPTDRDRFFEEVCVCVGGGWMGGGGMQVQHGRPACKAAALPH